MRHFPDIPRGRYEGSTHASHGCFVLISCLCLSAIDIARFVVRLYAFLRSIDKSKFAFKPFWRNVVLGREVDNVTAEYTYLDVEERPEFEEIQMKPPRLVKTQEPLNVQRNQFFTPVQTQYSDDRVDDETAPWANDPRTSRGVHRHARSSSSERTVFEVDPLRGSRHPDDILTDFKFPGFIKPRSTLIRRIAQGAFATLERTLVFAAFAMSLSGIVVYTGGCRGNYINGCLAHLISA